MMSTTDMSDEKKRPWSEINFKTKLRKIRENITVEPLLALYIIPSVLSNLATQNLYLDKACRVNLNYSDEICHALSQRLTTNYTAEETEVQKLVVWMQGWKTILQSFLPALLILPWGSWSDRHQKRKVCMIIPIIGELAAAIGLMICTYQKDWRMEIAGVTEALFPGLAGGWFTMLMGVFSYIADITTEEERTLRIGIVNLCFSLGVPTGMAFSGILLKLIGFYGVFATAAALYVAALIYGVFFVQEKVRNDEKKMEKLSSKSLFADFFDYKHVIETLRVAFKSGENQRRSRVIMLLIVVMVVIGPFHGEMSVMYLFTRFKFHWSEIEFSLFSTYSMLVGMVGTLVSIGVFSHLLKFDDAIIGVLSSLSKVLSGFVYAFAATTLQFCLGPVAEILNGTSFIAIRSIASKLVPKEELGKLNSLIGVGEALTPLVFAPMYTQVYRATIGYFPGAFFLLGGALTFPAVIIFIWLYKIHEQDRKRKDLANRPENFDNIDNAKGQKDNNGYVNESFVLDDEKNN